MDLSPFAYLQPGQGTRARHDCGDGRPAQVTRDGAYVRAWCHRCREAFSLRLEETQEQRVQRLREWARGDGTVERSIAPPEPRTAALDAFPLHAKAWLYRGGLSREDIGRLGVYYHAPSDRVVIPLPGFWLARAYPEPGRPARQPKYLAPEHRPADLLVRFGPTSGPIVIVEDALSALKVSKVFDTWALLGTRLPPRYLTEILKSKRPVVTWLDPDPPGQSAARDIRVQLRGFGVQVHNVLSLRDPKLHTTQEILEYVGRDHPPHPEISGAV